MKNIALLTLATCIWGLGFVATRWTFSAYTPVWSNSMRYVFAGIISLILLIAFNNKFNRVSHKGAFICSVFLFLGLATQTVGIAYTTLAKSGFLTTLYAIFTPIFLSFSGEKLSKKYWLYLSIAMIGIALLCEFKIDNFNQGDFYITLSAAFFSLHILSVDKFAKGENPLSFNLWQCVYIGIIGFIFGAFYEGIPSFDKAFTLSDIVRPSPFLGFVVLAVFSSIIAFSIQVKVQSHIKPHIVSVIFLMESVFASFFGFLFFGETLSLMAFMGCFLILLSVFFISRTTQKIS